MISELLTLERANEIHAHYTNYNTTYFQEEFIISELGKEMYNDLKISLSENNTNKSEVLIVAITNWLKKDVEYYLKFISQPNKRMYEWDIVTSLQLMSDIVNLCSAHKLLNASYLLQRECSKLNVKYSIVSEHVRLSA